MFGKLVHKLSPNRGFTIKIFKALSHTDREHHKWQLFLKDDTKTKMQRKRGRMLEGREKNANNAFLEFWDEAIKGLFLSYMNSGMGRQKQRRKGSPFVSLSPAPADSANNQTASYG